MKWTFNQVTEAVNFLNGNKDAIKLLNSNYPSVENIINNKDVGSAKTLISRFGIKLYSFKKIKA